MQPWSSYRECQQCHELHQGREYYATPKSWFHFSHTPGLFWPQFGRDSLPLPRSRYSDRHSIAFEAWGDRRDSQRCHRAPHSLSLLSLRLIGSPTQRELYLGPWELPGCKDLPYSWRKNSFGLFASCSSTLVAAPDLFASSPCSLLPYKDAGTSLRSHLTPCISHYFLELLHLVSLPTCKG